MFRDDHSSPIIAGGGDTPSNANSSITNDTDVSSKASYIVHGSSDGSITHRANSDRSTSTEYTANITRRDEGDNYSDNYGSISANERLSSGANTISSARSAAVIDTADRVGSGTTASHVNVISTKVILRSRAISRAVLLAGSADNKTIRSNAEDASSSTSK